MRQLMAMAVATAAIVWSIAIPTAAARIHEQPPGLGSRLSTAVYLVSSVICHQRPERSFFTGQTAWPVCARCAGLYGGAAVGAVFALLIPVRRDWRAFVHRARVLLAIA